MRQNQKQRNSYIEDDEIQYLILLSGFSSQKYKYYRLQKQQLFGHQPKRNIYSKCLALAVILFLVIVAFLLYAMAKASINLPREFNIQKDIISAVVNSNNLTAIQNQKIQHEQFIINPCVWIFQKHNPSFLDQLIISNNKRFASLSNFKVQTLTTTNYYTFISEEGNTKLENIFNILKQRIHNDSSLERNFNVIQKRLILFSILYERGGIVIDSPLTLTENFDWIRQIQSNIYVNRGDPDTKPQVVGFYSPFYSSDIKKEQKRLKAGMEEVDRYMVIFPAIESYFIAAKERAEFIGRVLEDMISILRFPKSVNKDIEDGNYEYFKRKITDVYYQSIFLAGNRVIQTRQLELDLENNNHSIRNFAIDSYGLFLINCYYGPQKLHVTLSNVKVSRRIQNIAKYDLEEFENSVGPMRYLQITAIFNSLNDFLTRIRDNKVEKQIMKGSYLQQMYFPEANEPFIYINPQKGKEDLNASRWDSLPKIIWLFWDTGLEDVEVETYLCIQNLRKMSSSSGFQVKEVNNSNLNDYIEANTLSRIQFTIKNGKMHIFRQTKSDIIRLALLYKYGGIYLDTSVIAVINFDWLVNIAKFPTQYIFNRYGELPSVFMFWNPNFGGLLEWEVDSTANTKAGWHFSYQNSIIAAVKGSELIKDWFDLFLQLLMQPISEVLKILEQCNISNYQWVHQNDQYLLAMDAIKCAIGRRQIWMTKQNRTEWKNSMDYYKLWSMSSFFGPFKIRSYMNYANVDRYGNNPFFTRYSEEYVKGITGKANFMLKFISSQKQKLLTFIEEKYNKLKEETHSQSLFMKYFYNHTQGRFEKTHDIIELISLKK